jgi:hypothetical protein
MSVLRTIQGQDMKVEIERLGDGPIIRPDMDSRMGDNVNGPSLIEVPEWIPDPLGRYYLYFAHHNGGYIRLAYADSLTGPWRTHEAGVLPLAESHFEGHIASPDVYVDADAQRIRMYFHGAKTPMGRDSPQFTRAALSTDGLHFQARAEILGEPYMRGFRHDGWHYAIAMPGVFYRSRDGLSDFETGPTLFNPDMRHAAVLVRGNRLLVFYTQVGEMPERILLSEIDLTSAWTDWRPGAPRVLLEPERDYEGATLELRPSIRGVSHDPVRELRDPGIFEADDALYLLYSVAGEKGIALARMTLQEE